MKTHSIRLIMLLSLVLLLGPCLSATAKGPQFIENLGQWEEHVRHRADFPGGALFVESGAFTYLFYGEELTHYLHPSSGEYSDGVIPFHAYQTRFLGASHSKVSGELKQSDYRNFYLGNDPQKWASRVGVYERIRQSDLYPGVDLIMYTSGGSLKYDFKLGPGANPEVIQMEYLGADGISLRNGNLFITTSLGEVMENAPYAYQLMEGKLRQVECSYVLKDNIVGFALGDYDSALPLVIDPELSFASYSGSVANNFGFTATDDSDGNLYAGSIAYSGGYPTTLGAFQQNFNSGTGNAIDVVLSKFASDGSQLIFSTYLGGSGQEMPHSIIVNSLDELIVMGNTGSSNFPVILSSYDPVFNGGTLFNFVDVSFGNMLHSQGCDVFVSCFSSDGSALVGSTYVGGSGNDGLNVGEMLAYNYGDVFRGEVIVNENDEVIVATSSGSTDFPVTAGAPQSIYHGGETDAVVFCLSPNLDNLVWSSYFGGSGDDSGYSVQLDSDGAVFLTGGTNSSNLATTMSSQDPSFNGMVDGYLARFNPAMTSLTRATYVGTTNYDQSYFVQLDGSGNVFVLGQTTGSMGISGGIYGVPGGKQFIRKFQNDLEEMIWSTVFGNAGADVDISPCAFLVSDCDQIYVSGWGGTTNNTHSPYINNSTTAGLPVTPDAFQSTTDGSDFYLMVLGPDATDLLYATFFGGGSSKEHVDGGTSKFDKNGSVYQAVCAGCGGFDDFPTSPGAWSEENNSSCNLGVFKFDLAQINAVIDLEGPPVACEGESIQFQNLSSGGTLFEWNFGDGSNPVSQFEPTHSFESPGTYEITLAVMDDNDCIQPDFASIEIEVMEGVNPSVIEPEPICSGGSTTLVGNGSDNAYWSASPTLVPGNDLTASVNPLEPTSYYLVDFNFCETDSVAAFVDFVVLEYSIEAESMVCIGETANLSASGGVQYNWSPAELLSDPDQATTQATLSETTTFYLNLITEEGCEVQDSLTVVVNFDAPGGEVYDPVSVCFGQQVLLQAEDGISWSWTPASLLNNSELQSPVASVDENTQFTVEITNACGPGISTVWVNVIVPEVEAVEDQRICFGESIPLWANGGVEYQWNPATGLSNSQSPEPLATPAQTTNYQVEIVDEFGCSLTEEVLVEVLPLPQANAGYSSIIPWYETTVLDGTGDGIIQWSPPEFLECSSCLQTTAWPDSSMWFSLSVTDENGCTRVDSVFIEVVGPLFVPNSFSPNADGTNDVFFAYSIGLEAFDLQIFNRWGELVFSSSDLNAGWDGTYRGEPAQVDVYVWKIRYKDPQKVDRIIRGHVNLIR